MADISLYTYIAAVLTFIVIPIQGQKVTCAFVDSIVADEQCYGVFYEKRPWTKAWKFCDRSEGNLAKFTSLEHVKEVFTTLALDTNVEFWIDAQNEADEEKLKRAALHSVDGDRFSIYSGSCELLQYPFICTENSRLTCLHKDAVLMDGICFRLSNESLQWSNARNYCNSSRGAVATISSVKQGIQVLTAMNISEISTWITDSLESDNGKLISLFEHDGCKEYRYGNTLSHNVSHQVLCVDKPIIKSESNLIPVSNTTQKSNDKSESTTKPTMTRRPESISANEQITTTPGQAKLANRNRLLHSNPLLHKNRLVEQTIIEFYARLGFYTN